MILLLAIAIWILITSAQGYSPVSEVFAEPGADVVLPLEVTLTRNKPKCDGYEWRQNDILLVRERNCTLIKYINRRHLTYNINQNASLVLYSVTREHAGYYTVQVFNSNRSSKYSKTFILLVQDPVSVPDMNITCDISGSAVIRCEVQNGTDLLYNWALNGDTMQGNNRSQWSVSVNKLVLFSPGPWNISCSVRNRVSERHSNLTTVMCPEPLSEPVLNVTCNKKDGSAVIVCSVKKGTDPKFSLVWNGLSNNSSVIFIPCTGQWKCHLHWAKPSLVQKHTQMSAFVQALDNAV
ncbi:HEPACAM family member 2-like [Bombina bombina]|uniref:HEPACAM family member 2-like n=1 Tax=Bombina bombina TaxID=8345 RepID=UPI00235B293E|nr:HEPACAM family member 2-like [Bombina bombina]